MAWSPANDERVVGERVCVSAPDTAAIEGVHPGVAALQDGEIILLSIRPSFAWAVRYWIPAIVVHWLLVVARALMTKGISPATDPFVIAVSSVLAAFLVAVTLNWHRRRYVLTDKRVLVVRGIFNREADEMPLTAVRRVQLVELRGPMLPRRGHEPVSGTMLFLDHGGSPGVRWDLVDRPAEVERVVCEAIKRYARGDFESG